jgi:hypothetical protein
MSIRRPSARVCGGVNVTTSSQVLVEEYSSRSELTITNNSDNDVSLALRVANGVNSADPTAVADDGIVLKANGGSWTTNSYTGPVAMIAGAASRVAVTDI